MTSENSGGGIRGWGLGKRFCLSCLLLFSTLGFARTASSNETIPSLKIAVRVYDYAPVPRETLARATREAAALFEKVGVETDWFDCRPVEKGGAIDPACQQDFGPTDLQLIIIASSGAVRLAFREAELGRAPAPTEPEPGSFSRVFYVYFDRVKIVAANGYAEEYQILACAILHEIGHVLLPTLRHATAGIMRGQWNPQPVSV